MAKSIDCLGTKTLHCLRAVRDRVNEGQRLELPPVWPALKIGRPDTGRRISASAGHTRLLLRPDALTALNAEALGILWAALRLDGETPHILRSDARRS